MTEMAQEVSGQVSSPAPIQSAAPADQTASQPTSERLFKQSEVNDLVGREKHEAVERYKRQQQQVQPPLQQQQQAPYQQQPPPYSSITEDDVRKTAASEIQRLRTEWIEEQRRIAGEQEAKRIATEFYAKFNRGKDEYQDWDSVAGNADLTKMPDIVHLANSVDNTHDVMYELIKNRHKASQLRQIAQDWGYEAAIDEIKRLSDSIKANKSAPGQHQPAAPLTQLRPSLTGTDNSGQRQVKDYRKMFRV